MTEDIKALAEAWAKFGGNDEYPRVPIANVNTLARAVLELLEALKYTLECCDGGDRDSTCIACLGLAALTPQD